MAGHTELIHCSVVRGSRIPHIDADTFNGAGCALVTDKGGIVVTQIDVAVVHVKICIENDVAAAVRFTFCVAHNALCCSNGCAGNVMRVTCKLSRNSANAVIVVYNGTWVLDGDGVAQCAVIGLGTSGVMIITSDITRSEWSATMAFAA